MEEIKNPPQTEPVQPQSPVIQPIQPKKSSKLPFIILGIVFFAALLAIGGFYFKAQQTSKVAALPTKAVLPTVVPTKDPTADWKTYTNKKNSFSFKYPSHFLYVSEYFDSNGVYMAPSEGKGEGKGTPRGLDSNNDSWLTVTATVLDKAGLETWSKELLKTNVTIDNINGYKQKYSPKPASEATYGFSAVFLKDSILYKIDLSALNEKLGYLPENETIFNEMLESFKFN